MEFAGPWMNVMKFLFLFAASGIAVGCVATPLAPLTADPSSPTTGMAVAPAYASTVAGYVARRPVEPEDWRTRNQSVAPGGSAR